MRRSILLASLCLVPMTTIFAACDSDDEVTPPSVDGGGDAETADGGTSSDAAPDPDVPDAADTPDANEGGGGCLTGGSPAMPSGTGTCASPFAIDLSGSPLGTVVSVTGTGGVDEAGFLTGASCGVTFDATARDLVFSVKLPNDVSSLDVSATGANADVRIGVAEDPSCGQPLNACANAGGAGVCEQVNAPKGGLGFFGTETYVIVSETASSNQPITVHVRAN